MGPWARGPIVPTSPGPWARTQGAPKIPPRGVGVSLEDIADLEVCSSNMSSRIPSPGTVGAGAGNMGPLKGPYPYPRGGGRLSDPGSRIREFGDPECPMDPRMPRVAGLEGAPYSSFGLLEQIVEKIYGFAGFSSTRAHGAPWALGREPMGPRPWALGPRGSTRPGPMGPRSVGPWAHGPWTHGAPWAHGTPKSPFRGISVSLQTIADVEMSSSNKSPT